MPTKDVKKIHDRIREYAREISEIKQREGEDAREDNFRPELRNLLNDLKPSSDFIITHEKKQPSGTPDFTVDTSSHGRVGYIECKNMGTDLKKYLEEAKKPGEQIEKYSHDTSNIILTDYVSFYLLTYTKRDKEIFIAKEVTLDLPKPELYQLDKLKAILRQFFGAQAQEITDAKDLAEFLAGPCGELRKQLTRLLEAEHEELTEFKQTFERIFNVRFKKSRHADVLAQTIVYGLFSAKLHNPTQTIKLSEADILLPKSFRVIKAILKVLRELDEPEVDTIIKRIESIVNRMDTDVIINSMVLNSQDTDETADPYLYFYEPFLSKYDPEMREKRGVYYTPAPVVKFIVRAIDDVLKDNFGYSGLDDKRVTLLDFAAGTGTFLIEIMRKIFDGHNEYWRNNTGLPHILSHIHGFEYLIAPYTLAHLKLTQFLSDNGVELKKTERLSICLTNTLEEPTIKQAELDGDYKKLLAENRLANDIKQQQVLVITGNPPYSVKSQNTGRWIKKLLRGEIKGAKKHESYFELDGEKLGERNPKSLDDDYVKFIRFAHYKMEQYQQGVVAVITNRAFLDNITFRGMRESLLNTFDRLYLLDLHGDADKEETVPGGENVFDIKKGVAISIFVKKPNIEKGVYHADLYGSRVEKYEYCGNKALKDINWKKLEPGKPFYFFIPRNTEGENDYYRFKSLNDIFITKSSGVQTSRDDVALTYSEVEMEERIKDMLNDNMSDGRFREEHKAKDTSRWKLKEARLRINELGDQKQYIKKISYRPFDTRWCFYNQIIVERMRFKKLHHLLKKGNLGLVSVRQSKSSSNWRHVFITDKLSERCVVSNRGSEVGYVYPLYLYNGAGEDENLKPEFRAWIDAHYGKEYEPKQILDYIYAALHSPSYRKKYAEFLKYDFPRVPFPESNAEFERLSKIGAELIDAHLLKFDAYDDLDFDGKGDGVINDASYVPGETRKEKGRLYINKGVYLSGVSDDVFKFQVGGYQPLKGYLKSRKGRKLSPAEQETLKRAATAIARTIELQDEIIGGAPK